MANWDLKDKTAIAGVGNSQFGRRLMRSPIDLSAEAIPMRSRPWLATRTAQRPHRQFRLTDRRRRRSARAVLGLNLRCYNQTWAHGRFTASCIQWAAMVVNAGLADAVACLAAVSFSGIRRPNDGWWRRSRGRARSRWWPRRGSGLRHDLARRRRGDGRSPLFRALWRGQPRAGGCAGRISQTRLDESACDHARAFGVEDHQRSRYRMRAASSARLLPHQRWRGVRDRYHSRACARLQETAGVYQRDARPARRSRGIHLGVSRVSASRSSRSSITTQDCSRYTKWRELLPRMSMRFSPTTRSRSSPGSRSSVWASARPARPPPSRRAAASKSAANCR